MRMSWRTYVMILLVGIWPHLGCHQVPGDKSVQDLRPIQQPAGPAKKLELTASDITQSWLAKAEKLEKDGKTAEALVLCEKMREPGSPHALQATKKIALLHDRRHDLDKAEQEYRLLLQQNPKDADTLVNLGYVYYRRGQWFAAEKFLSDGLKLKPDHSYGWVNMGMTLAQQGGRFDEAVEALSKVLSKSEAYCEVGFVLKLQGKPREAMAAYEQALKHEHAMPRATTELTKLRQAGPAPTVTRTTPYRPGQQGAVELEQTPVQASNEGTGRLMIRRPTLPPVPELDLPTVSNPK